MDIVYAAIKGAFLAGGVILAMVGASWLFSKGIDLLFICTKSLEERQERGAVPGGEKNRLRSGGATKQSPHISQHPHDSATTDVEPSETARKASLEGDKVAMGLENEIRKTDIVAEINRLKDRVEAIENLTPVIGNHGKEIEELKDKLAESIFILYGGKRPDGIGLQEDTHFEKQEPMEVQIPSCQRGPIGFENGELITDED